MKTIDNYIPRLADKQLSSLLKTFGSVLVRGPKWCGKTTTAEQIAESAIYFGDKSKESSYEAIAATNPALFLEGKLPRLIDEWQKYPEVWDAAKNSIDKENNGDLYILTGSMAPKKGTTIHTGSMRIAKVTMSTLSFAESHLSNQQISLASLFANPEQNISAVSPLDRQAISKQIVLGGFPAAFTREYDDPSVFGKQALASIAETDIQEATGKQLSPQTTKSILRSFARNISTYVENRTIIADVNANDSSLSETAFYDYYDGLQKLYVIKEIPSYSPNIRSKTAIRSLSKKEFFDPAIACAALGIGPGDLENDPKSRGFFFECLCSKELGVYAEMLGGELRQYHDRYNLEADFTIHLPDGRYALFECKCGAKFIEDGAKGLLAFKPLYEEHNLKFPTEKLPLPSFLAVITDEGMAYRRPDGVYVIPIGCLTM